jgi:putative transposase
MKYNPKKHHRRSIRLKGYDYSRQGRYFVTLCVQDRRHFFGEIINQEMYLNEAGLMIEKWYLELENKFPSIQCHEYVVMPNHFHCIIEITSTTVGADLCVCPDPRVNPDQRATPDQHVNPDQRVNPDLCVNSDPILGEHKNSPLSEIIQWFKTMSTNEYIRGVKQLDWPRFNKKLWQRNYYEHIIRNDRACDEIAEYIITNPQKWDNDRLR